MTNVSKIVNDYVTSKLGWDISSPSKSLFFPVHDATGVDAGWENSPYVVYDWIKLRNESSLYPIKQHQLLYSVRGKITEIYTIRDTMIDALDKEDIAALELNAWQANNEITDCVFFHSIRAWQSGRVLEPTSSKTYYTLPIIVEFDLALP